MEYKRSKIKRIPFDLNTETDADILQFLEEIKNKNGYIKNLIREDIDRRKKPWFYKVFRRSARFNRAFFMPKRS